MEKKINAEAWKMLTNTNTNTNTKAMRRS